MHYTSPPVPRQVVRTQAFSKTPSFSPLSCSKKEDSTTRQTKPHEGCTTEPNLDGQKKRNATKNQGIPPLPSCQMAITQKTDACAASSLETSLQVRHVKASRVMLICISRAKRLSLPPQSSLSKEKIKWLEKDRTGSLRR